MGIIQWSRNKFQDIVGEGSGTAGKDAEAGIRSPKPYASYYSNGLFEGEDGSVWLYFKMPEDVKVNYVESKSDAADNQAFLISILDSLGSSIRHTSHSTKKDDRIKFHIPMIREITTEIQQYDDITPAQSDFLKRMNISKRQVWHSYFGVELQMGSISSDLYSMSDKVRHYIDFMTGKVDVEYNLYRDSLELVTSVCMDNGMIPLDFEAHPEDFERLTAWYGVADEKYDMRPEITTTALEVPEHGHSIFTPGCGEIAFSAIRPKESRDMFMQDPYNENDVQFGRAILAPSVNAVHVNIRGEIRSGQVADDIMDKKVTRMNDRLDSATDENSSVSENRRREEDARMATIAASASQMHAFLDNTEVIVATIVTGKKNELNGNLLPYGLESVNTTMRQLYALNSTVPAYPNTVFKIPKGNSKRNPNVNSFYAGVLALSGLFSTTKPAGKKGILIGLSDANYDFKEIFIETNASNKYSQPPTTLVTGSSGSGKTVQMLMMVAQYVYLGTSAVFLNPKPQSTLKPFFDHLDGITINLSNHYLEENPGMLDPMFFIEDRREVGKLLADMVIRAQGMNSKSNDKMFSIRKQEELTTELVEHAMMPANECSWDIIMGNKRAEKPTPRLSDDDTVAFIRDKMKSSAFWKASISQDPDGRSNFQAAIKSGKPFLIEWDTSISMPTTNNEDDWTQQERDGVQSVVNLFKFGAEIIGNSRRGGVLVVDEAHVMQTSEVAMNLIKKSGREWRSQDINLMLATQNLSDFLGDDEYNIRAYVRLFIIMNVPDLKKELDIFFDITKFPRDEKYIQYITNASISSAESARGLKSIPNAIVMDSAYGIKTGIMAGPWPYRELSAASGKHVKDIVDDGSADMSMMTFEQFSNEMIDESHEDDSVANL